uniref:Thyroid hormone responsive n=1 Tax=Leptobrachium leishanense TaxID=445787 RepID=A0A8C5LZQ9_9ANUR
PLQILDSSLTTAIAKYSKAARNMEQMVLFPSLLRDVPQEDQASDEGRDLYDCYVKLKAIRMSLEQGLVPEDKEADGKITTAFSGEMFYHHFKGLSTVLNQLTQESNVLTSKYKDLLGVAQ